MASQDEEDKKLRRLLTWLGVLVGLVVAGVLTLALWEAHKNGDLGFGQPEAQVPSRAQVENGQVNMVPQAGDYALVENGIVKFYFATGSSNLAPNAEEVLAVVVDGVKHGRRAVISGYHDHTGNARSERRSIEKPRHCGTKRVVGFGRAARKHRVAQA